MAEPTSKAEATAAIEQRVAHVREISASTSTALASTANPLRGRAA
jgi:hypothetical protein